MAPKRVLSAVISWRGSILDTDLPAPAKLVALTLSTHMSERGDSCFPSLDTLTTETSLSKSSVCAHLKTLEAGGLLLRETGTKGRSTRYYATIPGSAGDGQPCTGDGQPCPPPAPELVQELPSKTPSPPARERDLVWDGLVSIFGEPLASQRSVYGRAVRDIRADLAGLSDHEMSLEVARLVVAYRSRFPEAAVTLNALVKHWGSLRAAPIASEHRYRDCPGCVGIGDPPVGCVDCGGTGRLRVS